MEPILREYETLFILHPELGEDAAASTTGKLKAVLEKMGAEMLREEPLGKKKLSFFVKKHQRGNFMLFHYLGKPGTVEELERTMRNQDEVLRYLTCGYGTVKDVAARKAEVEKMVRDAKARAEAERKQREEAAARAALSPANGELSEDDMDLDSESDRAGDFEE